MLKLFTFLTAIFLFGNAISQETIPEQYCTPHLLDQKE
jgi:hypothetical protein